MCACPYVCTSAGSAELAGSRRPGTGGTLDAVDPSGKLRDVLETGAGVGLVLPGGAPRAAAPLPHVHKLVHAGVVRLEDLAVVRLFLALGRVDGILCLRRSEIRVSHLRLAECLKVLDPVEADPLALHRLGAPQHGLGDLALEQRAQGVLLGLLDADDPLELRVHLHHGVDHVGVQEGHARLQAVRHGHAVRALAVHIVQRAEDAPQLLVDGG
mmetsp:Transcript_13902/g.33299  ORF Transcript_13902/g.33299 Transcript_13902/m.33299 type:complete len:213 (-) Transcript_13902:1478-2116(-)